MITICLGCDSTHMQAIVQKRIINVKHDSWQFQLTSKNTTYLIFRAKNFIGVRYGAFLRSILVMAHFVKPSQGAFLFIIAMPRVEHHGRSVLKAWWGFSSWTNVSRDGCQGCKEWQRIRISWNTRFRPLVLHYPSISPWSSMIQEQGSCPKPCWILSYPNEPRKPNCPMFH